MREREREGEIERETERDREGDREIGESSIAKNLSGYDTTTTRLRIEFGSSYSTINGFYFERWSYRSFRKSFVRACHIIFASLIETMATL